MDNIYKIPLDAPKEEIFEKLAFGEDVLIEKIISYGHKTPDGQWYDQLKDEWVLLLQGEATILYDDKISINLVAGDYIFIPKHKKHRVENTSTNPPCIWLAVHADLQTK